MWAEIGTPRLCKMFLMLAPGLAGTWVLRKHEGGNPPVEFIARKRLVMWWNCDPLGIVVYCWFGEEMGARPELPTATTIIDQSFPCPLGTFFFQHLRWVCCPLAENLVVFSGAWPYGKDIWGSQDRRRLPLVSLKLSRSKPTF